MTKRNILISLIIPLSMVFGIALAQPALAETEQKTCGGAKTSVLGCNETEDGAIFAVLRILVQILGAGVGVAAVGAVIFGAILYTSSGDNPENIKKAKQIWINTVIGLVLFAFMVAITDFLVPGGVFG